MDTNEILRGAVLFYSLASLMSGVFVLARHYTIVQVRRQMALSHTILAHEECLYVR